MIETDFVNTPKASCFWYILKLGIHGSPCSRIFAIIASTTKYFICLELTNTCGAAIAHRTIVTIGRTLKSIPGCCFV